MRPLYQKESLVDIDQPRLPRLVLSPDVIDRLMENAMAIVAAAGHSKART
jgi:hypothetical protein